ncbi:hypothetical protein Q8A67_005483 [Cirrhinus molitorella]|uniref:Uncharacterized protein n=1 Tax=Cirrhinus molitorella TaxID=172907 RepID=A0AA88Q618_9TELE|nr:hypothetical protein Q8A67_005483 [Cirrhinus molitorella]
MRDRLRCATDRRLDQSERGRHAIDRSSANQRAVMPALGDGFKVTDLSRRCKHARKHTVRTPVPEPPGSVAAADSACLLAERLLFFFLLHHEVF